MEIGIIQYDISKNISENIKKVSTLFETKVAELFLLPELCDYGYLFDSKSDLIEIATTIEKNKMVNFLCEVSSEKKCCIIAGVAEKVGFEIYNSAVVINDGEIIGTYRKIHLSDYEKDFFTQGTENKIFEINGIKIGVQICFDLWFPEMSRWQVLQGADILCAIGNFGGETTFEISKIRAIENLTTLALCNRVGNEKNKFINADFLGRSSIFASDGNKIFQAADNKEVSFVAQVKLEKKKGNLICKDFESEIGKHY